MISGTLLRRFFHSHTKPSGGLIWKMITYAIIITQDINSANLSVRQLIMIVKNYSESKFMLNHLWYLVLVITLVLVIINSLDGLEARVDKLTLTLLLQWRSKFNNAFFGGRGLDLLVRMRMSSPSFNRLPSESRSSEWILQMIGSLEEISFANIRRNCAFESEIICKWFGTRISRRL